MKINYRLAGMLRHSKMISRDRLCSPNVASLESQVEIPSTQQKARSLLRNRDSLAEKVVDITSESLEL